jgi:hypothetical protein
MTDALTALEQMSADVTKLAATVSRTRGKTVEPERVRLLAKSVALVYYESVRPELDVVKERAGLVDEIDFVIAAILQLSTAAREKTAYVGQLNELRPYIQEAMVCVMKARGTPRLVLSLTERGILDTLKRMLPTTALSYEQVLRDVTEGQRVSWRGPGTELREVLREVMDHLAPDDQVMAAPGFQLEPELKRPTQKQKVRFILKARKSKSGALAVSEASVNTFEEGIATLARSTYQRGAVSTHTPTDGAEIRKLKGYVDALLVELLEVAG